MEYSFIDILILFFGGGVITLLIRSVDEKYSYKKYNDLSKEIIILRRNTCEYFDAINNDVMLLAEDIQQLKEKVIKLERDKKL